MKDIIIAFIGGGNMARSLIGGLLVDGVSPDHIQVADPDTLILKDIRERLGVRTYTNNIEATYGANAVVLAVKPQIAQNVVQEIAPILALYQPVFISIAAGIPVSSLRFWVGIDMAIVRSMPNTPALVGAGATALYANPTTSQKQKSLAESILRAVGIALWLEDEPLMDVVTALSGSGPAYFFLVMEALEKAGHALGLPREVATLLTLQTAFGAAKMALETPKDLATMRRRVTSPGGTTEQAIKVLQEHNIEGIFAQAVYRAYNRSTELAMLFGHG